MGLAGFIKKKPAKYEVSVCVEGRWTIEGIVEKEDEAEVFARQLLNRSGTEEVIIVRIKNSSLGKIFETEIFREKPTHTKEAPITLGEVPKRLPACETVEDLFSFASRLEASRIFRMFLVRNNLTITELLHNWKYIQKLADTGSILNAAIYKVAAVQAEAMGVGQKERVQVLDRFTNELLMRGRELAAERKKVPRPDEDTWEMASAKIKARFDEDQHDYIFMSVMAQKFFGISSVAGKMEMALEIQKELEPELAHLLTPIVAEAMDFSEVVQDLFGSHRHLASFLLMLIDLLNGDINTEVEGFNPNLKAIIGLIDKGEGDDCRAVMIERLGRELDSGKPFDRRSPEKDKVWLDKITGRLAHGDIGLKELPTVKRGIAARKKKFRADELRKLGLHEAADAL